MEEFEFKFSVDAVNTILKGLSELPAKESYGIINQIYKTVDEQNKKKEETHQLEVKKD